MKENKEEHEKLAGDVTMLAEILKERRDQMKNDTYRKAVQDLSRSARVNFAYLPRWLKTSSRVQKAIDHVDKKLSSNIASRTANVESDAKDIQALRREIGAGIDIILVCPFVAQVHWLIVFRSFALLNLRRRRLKTSR